MWVGADFMATTKRETCAQLEETYTMDSDVTLHMQLWWFPAHSVLPHSEKRPADYSVRSTSPFPMRCDAGVLCVCSQGPLCERWKRLSHQHQLYSKAPRDWTPLEDLGISHNEEFGKARIHQKPRLKDFSLWKLHMTDSILQDIKLNIPFPFCSLLSLAKYHSHFICYICSNQNLFRLSPQMVCQHSRGEVKVNTHT